MNDTPQTVPKAPAANAPLTDEQRARRQAEAKRAESASSDTRDAGPKVAAKAEPKAQKPAAEPVVQVLPPAPKAKVRKRHWGLLLSFILLVVAPTAGAGWYLWERAADRYVSYVGFSVRKEEVSSASDLLGSISSLSGSSSSDTNILYNFIQSQELVHVIDDKLDLQTLWSKADPDVDPVFAFHAPGSIEDLTRYWGRMVKVYSDSGSGLIDMTVQAFTPQDAQNIAEMIYSESSTMINRLSTIARDDGIEYAKDELNLALENLRLARQKITQFRNRTQIVDPSANIQSQMGLLASLETQLVSTQIDLDILLQTSSDADPRVITATRRLDAIKSRIAEERNKLGFTGENGIDASSGYADIVDEYEGLAIDLTFAEETYAVSRAAYASALAEARRQQRYLAAHVRPTLAETPEHPSRIALLALFGLFAFLLWTLLALVSYAIKDRR